jgi:hypothetical protein
MVGGRRTGVLVDRCPREVLASRAFPRPPLPPNLSNELSSTSHYPTSLPPFPAPPTRPPPPPPRLMRAASLALGAGLPFYGCLYVVTGIVFSVATQVVGAR